MVDLHRQSMDLFQKLMREEITQEEFQKQVAQLKVPQKKVLAEFEWYGEEE